MNLIRCRALTRLLNDERGTSLTEFAITMPIFIMVMSFVYYMGVAGHVLSQETGEAQRLMWDEVMEQNQDLDGPISRSDPDQPHVHPGPAAELDEEFLLAYELRQKRGDLREEIHFHEEGAHQALAAGGHWGESHWRTRPAADVVSFQNHGDEITDDLGDVVGASPYARLLVDDSPATGEEIQVGAGGSGALSPMASEGFESDSVIPAVGAGVRYGVIHGIQEGEIEFPHGWTLPVRFAFDVLAPPTPNVHSERETSAITRTQLENFFPYSEVLGIQEPQNYFAEEPPPPADWPSGE